MDKCTVEPGVSVTQHIQRYVQGLRVHGYSPKTIEIYTRGIRVFEEFLARDGVEDLQSVGKDHLNRYRRYLHGRSYQPASIEIFLRSLKGFFRYLEDGQHLFLNPAEDLVVQQAERRLLPVPTEEDICRLMEQPDTRKPTGIRDRAILETAYGTGARLGELSSLQLQSLQLGDQTVRLLGKGRRERLVPLGEAAAAWIERYLTQARPGLLGPNASDALWISSRRAPLSYMSMGMMIRRYGQEAGIGMRITPHALRRACATHMLRRGADPVSIQQLLGHSSLKHLSQYLRVTITEIKAMHQKSTPGR